MVLERGGELGYVAICPSLRGCVAQGKTRQEALKNMNGSIMDYIGVPQEVGRMMVDVEVVAH